MRTINEEEIESIGITKRDLTDGLKEDWSSDVQLEAISIDRDECILFVKYKSGVGRGITFLDVVLEMTDACIRSARVFEYKTHLDRGFTEIKAVY